MLTSPPDFLVRDGWVPRYGMFNGPIKDVNLHEARVQGWPGPLAKLRFKQWQHFVILHPKGALTFAVVDTGYLKLGWLQVIDHKHGDHYEHRRQSPFLDVGVAKSLWDEATWLSTKGLQISVRNNLNLKQHAIRLHADRSRHAAPVEAHLICHATTTPLVVCLPLERNRAMYSHKVALPVEGEIRAGNQVWQCDPAECTAILDVHKAHYPNETWWRWATAVGFAKDGRRVAFNFTQNLVQEEFPHENAAWIDDRLVALTPSVAQVEHEPWTMATRDGASSLSFEGRGQREEDLDLKLLRSQFKQRFGWFTGNVQVDGEDIPVERWFGLFEDHYARW